MESRRLFDWRKTRPLLMLIAGIALGASAMYAYALAITPKDNSVITRLGGYQFINPLLSCDINEDTPNVKFSSLRATLKNKADALASEGTVKRISIYVRDMDNGRWTGVNENDRYAPASLLKVPLLVTYLNEDRLNPAVLSTEYRLSVPQDLNAREYFKPGTRLEIGAVYTVKDLLRAMIEQSDNNATDVLLKHVNAQDFAATFDAFGVPSSPDQNADSMSTKDYMRFFRIIYNGTYLGNAHSILALDMLTKIDFPQGLLAGIPQNIPLANKFGERTMVSNGAVTKRELSDCGIVYYPGSPYGICVMAEGDDFDTMTAAIADISHTVYTAVDAGLLKE